MSQRKQSGLSSNTSHLPTLLPCATAVGHGRNVHLGWFPKKLLSKRWTQHRCGPLRNRRTIATSCWRVRNARRCLDRATAAMQDASTGTSLRSTGRCLHPYPRGHVPAKPHLSQATGPGTPGTSRIRYRPVPRFTNIVAEPDRCADCAIYNPKSTCDPRAVAREQ
jgi:hypothetical protein